MGAVNGLKARDIFRRAAVCFGMRETPKNISDLQSSELRRAVAQNLRFARALAHDPTRLQRFWGRRILPSMLLDNRRRGGRISDVEATWEGHGGGDEGAFLDQIDEHSRGGFRHLPDRLPNGG